MPSSVPVLSFQNFKCQGMNLDVKRFASRLPRAVPGGSSFGDCYSAEEWPLCGIPLASLWPRVRVHPLHFSGLSELAA